MHPTLMHHMHLSERLGNSCSNCRRADCNRRIATLIEKNLKEEEEKGEGEGEGEGEAEEEEEKEEDEEENND